MKPKLVHFGFVVALVFIVEWDNNLAEDSGILAVWIVEELLATISVAAPVFVIGVLADVE